MTYDRTPDPALQRSPTTHTPPLYVQAHKLFGGSCLFDCRICYPAGDWTGFVSLRRVVSEAGQQPVDPGKLHPARGRLAADGAATRFPVNRNGHPRGVSPRTAAELIRDPYGSRQSCSERGLFVVFP